MPCLLGCDEWREAIHKPGLLLGLTALFEVRSVWLLARGRCACLCEAWRRARGSRRSRSESRGKAGSPVRGLSSRGRQAAPALLGDLREGDDDGLGHRRAVRRASRSGARGQGRALPGSRGAEPRESLAYSGLESLDRRGRCRGRCRGPSWWRPASRLFPTSLASRSGLATSPPPFSARCGQSLGPALPRPALLRPSPARRARRSAHRGTATGRRARPRTRCRARGCRESGTGEAGVVRE